jgi:hypothetical protein
VELDRLSVTGLRAIAWVCIGSTALSNFLTLVVLHQPKIGIFALEEIAIVGIGLAGLALSYWKP